MKPDSQTGQEHLIQWLYLAFSTDPRSMQQRNASFGLETQSGGEGKLSAGDRDAVWRVARQVGQQQALRRKEKEEAEWEDLMQQHERFVSQATKSRGAVAGWSIQEAKGTYIIKCDEMGSYSAYHSSANNMRLRIIDKGERGWCRYLRLRAP